MIILIAGVTGNIGQHAARHGLAIGHQIRGLGRSPAKLSDDIKSQLESFEVSKNYDDIDALDRACSGVDAIICAYSGLPELHLEGQLLLLRAAERAGVKRFLAAGWNYDWRKTQVLPEKERGSPIYEPIIAFHRHAAMSSAIRPCHIFSGMLAEVFFGLDGQDGFTPRDHGVWDGTAINGARSMDIWGSGDEVWNFSTESDAGKWGVDVVTAKGAEKGGFFEFVSWSCSLNQLRSVYEETRGTGKRVHVSRRGSVEELESLAQKERERLGLVNFWEWHRLWFHLFCVKGLWNLDGDGDGFDSDSASANLRAFLKSRPEI